MSRKNRKQIASARRPETPAHPAIVGAPLPAVYRRVTTCALAAACGLLYFLSLTPGVGPTDSGELTLAAWLPGVAHAPGSPTYTLLGWLWTHLLPLGSVAWRLNALSAVCGAAAAALVFVLALRTLQSGGAIALAAAVCGVLALALGRTTWQWATVVEVYAPTLAISAAILVLLARAAPASDARGERGEVPARTLDARLLLVVGLLAGLGLGLHLTSVALLASAGAVWLTLRYGWRFWRSRPVLAAALGLLLGLATHAYLPLRAAADPMLNWGQPDTWQRFWWHVTAKQYRVSLLSSPVGPEIALAGRLWWTQLTPVGIALALYGIRRMARRDRPLFAALLTLALLSTLYAWAYVIEDDQDAYYLPAFLAGAVWVAWGVEGILARIWDKAGGGGKRALGWAVVVAVPVVALLMNMPAGVRRWDTIPADYVRDTFDEIAPGGLLLTRDWQLYSPALYLQHVEGLRPDVTVIDTELMRRGWYYRYLHRVDPALMDSVASEEAAFLRLRDAWERGEFPAGDPRLAALQEAYVALLDALIARAGEAGRPVHAGPNRGNAALRALTAQGLPDLEEGAGRARSWVPIGLTFEAQEPGQDTPSFPALEPGQTAPELAAALGWRSDAFRRTRLTAPERKIQASRADMATLRGLVRAQAGDLAGAVQDWRTALVFDPAQQPAIDFLRQAGAAP